MARTGAAVRVEGLQPLLRDMGRVEKGLRRELQKELDEIAKHVRDEARDRAQAEGLRDKGGLVRGVKHRVKGSTALIRSTRTRGGFPYPAVYEFGGRGAGKYGPRAFLYPTVEKELPTTVRMLGEMLDRLTSANGLGRGGSL